MFACMYITKMTHHHEIFIQDILKIVSQLVLNIYKTLEKELTYKCIKI